MFFMIFFCFVYAFCMVGCSPRTALTDPLALHTVPEVSVEERAAMKDTLERAYVTEKGELERERAFLENDPLFQREQDNTSSKKSEG